MKKIISFLIVICLCLISSGCEGNQAKAPIVNNIIKTTTEIKLNDLDFQSKMLYSEDKKDNSKSDPVMLNVITVKPNIVPVKPDGSKNVYFTFDDGPSSGTIQLLNILDQFNIKATFFVTGKYYPQVKGLYKEISKRGHTIGLHSYTHNYSTVYASVEAFFSDFQRIQDVVYNETGLKPKIMRFPGGSNNTVSASYSGSNFMRQKLIPETIKRGYVYFDWNSCGNDAVTVNPTKDYIVKSVFQGIAGKKDVIVLLHDSNFKWTLDALPEIIQRFKDEGYEFKTLSTDSFNYQYK